MRQVDDFAVATPNERTASILLDMIDERLSIPMKRQGFLDMYNGIDIIQTRFYIKLTCITYINKICDKYLSSWIRNFTTTDIRPTPFPTDPNRLKNFNAATGNPDPKIQANLAKTTGLSYRSGVGEMIWAMTTCRPDVAFASVKLSQANCCPHDHHFHGLKHALKYLYSTREDGLYFWRTAPRMEFKEGPFPTINSNKQDLLLQNRPEYDANVLHAYADSDWATCVKTRRSFGGTCIRLAGGTIAYKCKFQHTVVGASKEAKFMAAYNTDNDACTAMGIAQKPTSQTRHIDIKYFSLCEWIEHELMLLERIDTMLNMSDHLTKVLSWNLFHRHADFWFGTYTDQHTDFETFVPPSFTTPMTAAAARVYAPIKDDYNGNPWLNVLWHGECNPICFTY
jgi:hypothetical protein